MATPEEIRELVRAAVRQALAEPAAPPASAAPSGPASYSAPWTGVAYDAHPSRHQFNIQEASLPAADLIEFLDAKLCTIEKNKPCDQCGMCKSLGF